jgi:hypothetical protein
MGYTNAWRVGLIKIDNSRRSTKTIMQVGLIKKTLVQNWIKENSNPKLVKEESNPKIGQQI